MSEEIEAITETAKAVQETAKTGQAIIVAGSGAAQFVSKVLGTVPQDVVGLTFGDFIGELRIRNLEKLQRKTEKILHDRGVEEPISVSPKLAIPLFEAASEETDETLQEMWANLLANSMDPNKYDISLQRVLTETLSEFEPVDVAVLNYFGSISGPDILIFSAQEIAEYLRIRESLASLSAKRLEQFECIREREVGWSIESLGQELYLACQPDPADQT